MNAYPLRKERKNVSKIGGWNINSLKIGKEKEKNSPRHDFPAFLYISAAPDESDHVNKKMSIVSEKIVKSVQKPNSAIFAN